MNRTIALAIFLAGFALACDNGANPGGKCLEGEPIACTCDDGRRGAGICGEDACDCPPTYELAAEPASLELGEVARGASRDGQVTLHNPAPREVRIRSIELFPMDEGFELLPGTPSAIPAADSVTVGVRFTATTPQAAAVARLRVEPEDADMAPVEVTITALVPGPLLSCSPATVGFSDTWLGTTRSNYALCTNVGIAGETDAALLRLDRLEVEGMGFSAAWNEALPAAGLAVGETGAVIVRFTPEVAGHVTGMLTIGGEGLLQQLTLSGVGSELPACDLELPTLPRFGTVEGAYPATLELSIRNRGYGPCTVERVGLCEGTDPAYSMAGAPTEPVEIPPGGDLRLAVMVVRNEILCTEPEDAGCIELEVSPSPEPIKTIPLPCRGEREPSILPVPSELDLGRVEADCGTANATIDLVNTASLTATIDRVELGEGTPAEFFIRSFPPPGTEVGPGMSTSVTVAYRPVDLGVDQGTLLIGFEEEEPLAVPLRGEGWLGPPRRDRFIQVTPVKFDLLVVLDNGSSMPEEAAWLRKKLGDLPDRLLPFVDFQLAVTTTGLVAGGPGCPGGVSGGEDGRLFPVDNTRPRILDRNTPNLRATWEANLSVGTCHHAPPQGLEAALRALTPPLSTNADDPRHTEVADGNLGFLRPDAILQLLLVSDRADASPGIDGSYEQAFLALKDGYPHMFRFAAVTGDRVGGCNSTDRSAVAGDRLFDFAMRSQEWEWNSICAQELNLALLRPFGARLKSCFHLGNYPRDLDQNGSIDGSELRVWVDEVELSELGAGGPWWYDAEQTAVCFDPERLPPPGSEVEIEYHVYCRSW